MKTPSPVNHMVLVPLRECFDIEDEKDFIIKLLSVFDIQRCGDELSV